MTSVITNRDVKSSRESECVELYLVAFPKVQCLIFITDTNSLFTVRTTSR